MKDKILKGMFLITFANIAGKFLGFFKDILISYYYGVTPETDALFLAASIPTLVLGMFTSSADSAIIPQYNRLRELGGRKAADKVYSNIINVISVIAIIISISFVVFPNYIVKIFAPGFEGSQLNLASKFLIVFCMFGIFHIWYCFFCAYNTNFGEVKARAILSLTSNVFIIIALIFVHDERMISIAIAYLVGYFLNAFLPIISSKKLGYKHSFAINLDNTELHQFARNFFPIMGTAFLIDIQMFVDKNLASSSLGGITALNYGSRLTSIFDSMLVVGVGIMILPALSKFNINGEKDKFVTFSTKTIKYILIVLYYFFIVSMFFSTEIITVIYKRGAFGANEVELVKQIFFMYAPGILLMPIQAILVKIFHSIEDTVTPFKVNLFVVILNIVLSIILSNFMGLPGIALGTSVSQLICCVICVILLSKKVGWDKKELGVLYIVKYCIITAVLMLVPLLCKQIYLSTLIKLIIESILVGIVYVILLFVFMNRDLKAIIKTVLSNIDSKKGNK